MIERTFHEMVKLSNIRLRHINLESNVRIDGAAIASLLYRNAIIIHLDEAAMELYWFHGRLDCRLGTIIEIKP